MKVRFILNCKLSNYDVAKRVQDSNSYLCEMENLLKMILVFNKNKRTVSKVVFVPKLVFLH